MTTRLWGGKQATVFKLEIVCENAAFGESEDERRAEVARILRNAGAMLVAGGTPDSLWDWNGQQVGTAKFFQRRIR